MIPRTRRCSVGLIRWLNFKNNLKLFTIFVSIRFHFVYYINIERTKYNRSHKEETHMTQGNDFLTDGEEVNVTAPGADEAAAEAKDTRVWTLADGSEVSKSEFIREQFTLNNLSRKQISEDFDINYRTVYGATVNMVNEAEPATRGRSASNAKIQVTAEGQVATEIEGVLHLNNVAVEGSLADTATEDVDRNDWIKEQVEGGASRGDVAGALGLSYGVVYSLTKDVAGASQRHEVELNGEMVSRSEYIRAKFDNGNGMSKADIAKELGVDYPVVWSALKSLKSEDEKYAESIDKVIKFEGQVEDVDTFNALIAELKGLALKQVEVTADASEESPYADAE